MYFEPITMEYRYQISIPDFKKFLVDNDKSIKIEGHSTAYESPFRCYDLRSGKITHNKQMMFVEWTISGEYFDRDELREYIINGDGREIFKNLFNKTFPDNYFEVLPDLKQYLGDYNTIQEFLNKKEA